MEINLKTVDTFKGAEKDRKIWVKKTVDEIINETWDEYDDDGNGDLDEEESFNFVQEFIEGKNGTGSSIDYYQFQEFFPKLDIDGDGCIGREEMSGKLVTLVQGDKKITNKEQLVAALQSKLRLEIGKGKTV